MLSSGFKNSVIKHFRNSGIILVTSIILVISSCSYAEKNLMIITIYEPEIIQPLSGTIIKSEKIDFIFNIHHESYQMQIATDTDFNDILINERIYLETSRDTSFYNLTTGIFKNGTYYYRIRNLWNVHEDYTSKSNWVVSNFIISK